MWSYPTRRALPWVNDFIEECSAFPNAAHDDQVDTMTQALHKLLLTPSLTNFFQRLDDRNAPAAAGQSGHRVLREAEGLRGAGPFPPLGGFTRAG